MRVFRAVGIRTVEAAARRQDLDLADLSTYSARASGTLPPDAVSVAPPRSGWVPLPGPVPGRLVAGSLPPEDFARFLLRLPKDWNGCLVVAASPGFTNEHGYDLYWSDFLITRGYAFACMDKGLCAAQDAETFYIPQDEPNRIRHWLRRFQDLAVFAAQEAAKHYGRTARRTYAVGVSNGGYLVRRLLEESPSLVDGGVDVSGVLWREDDNLLTQLPAALRAADGAAPDRAALKALGFPADPEWDGALAMYRAAYWEASLAVFLSDLDPSYVGPLRDYDLAQRPAAVRQSLCEIANTGGLGKPLVSLSGRRDLLITAARHAEAYRDLVASQGRAGLHRLILVDDATHVDLDRDFFPAAVPLMPHAHEAFLALTAKLG